MGHGRNIAGRRPLAITRRFELCDERGLVELRDGAEHFAHQDRGRRVLGEMIGRAGRHRGDAEALEVVVARELCRFGARGASKLLLVSTSDRPGHASSTATLAESSAAASWAANAPKTCTGSGNTVTCF